MLWAVYKAILISAHVNGGECFSWKIEGIIGRTEGGDR